MSNCGNCKQWAPYVATRNFIGRCIHPQRPNDRSTDKVDTCALFETKHVENVVGRSAIEEFLE